MLASEVVRDIHGARRMTPSDYDRERAKIREQYGDSNAEASALRDQALASLFYRSGWTQIALAQVEGCSRAFIEKRLRFGNFLQFATGVAFPRNLTERRFRGYWERTDKHETNDRIRFAEVLKLMAAETTLARSHAPKRELGEAIVKKFGDGEWHKLATIVAHVEAPEDDVMTVVELMRERGTYRTHCERKKVGAAWHYRIARHDGRVIALDALKEELRPILDGLKAEGKKNMATMSPNTVAHLAHQLELLIERLAK